MKPPLQTTSFRYPNEQVILFITLFLVFVVIAVSATVTLCASGIFVVVMIFLAYLSTRTQHQMLMAQALPVSFEQTPQLANIAQECAVRMQPGGVEVFVVPSRQLNAYTFGLTRPKSIVLYSTLVNLLDEDELRFVLGHEMGHVRLGHTWLNTIIGGLAGIPSPYAAAVVLVVAFRWWNRACEFSADRAGLLVCGKPEKAISALVKLVAGPAARTRADYERAMRSIEAEDDDAYSLLGEALSTHPMLVKRIEHIKEFAASAQYRQLMA